ncbi:TetR/AcrR family transcriptional regulator [Pseudomonas sp. RL_5y_Pfl2_73]|uniref:TetR/AcrR family transcriptional regulator n=1 Tax=Pseudomonas sp. RL_5y_Pfl2_73 TaxID=3088713 RepID=UPI0030DC4769
MELPKAPMASLRRPLSSERNSRPPRVERGSRSDGTTTRIHILETAGELFADGGYSRTTVKEICVRANTNAAAVNYHFGGRDGLYEAVLIEAHSRMVSLEELHSILGDGTPPDAQFERLLRTLLGPYPESRKGWAMRVLIKEVMAPTEHIPVLLREAILPKMQILFSIVARVLGLPVNHPGVQRGVLFAVVPCMVLIVSPPPIRDIVFPDINADLTGTINELTSYALAGLKALRLLHSPESISL